MTLTDGHSAEASSAEEDLPEEVAALFARHIDSYEKLDLVLLMRRHVDRSWTVLSAGAALTLPVELLRAALKELLDHGIVARDEGANYRYAPQTQALAVALTALADHHRANPTQILNRILPACLARARAKTATDAGRLIRAAARRQR